jgi:hypothetical protein
MKRHWADAVDNCNTNANAAKRVKLDDESKMVIGFGKDKYTPTSVMDWINQASVTVMMNDRWVQTVKTMIDYLNKYMTNNPGSQGTVSSYAHYILQKLLDVLPQNPHVLPTVESKLFELFEYWLATFAISGLGVMYSHVDHKRIYRRIDLHPDRWKRSWNSRPVAKRLHPIESLDGLVRKALRLCKKQKCTLDILMQIEGSLDSATVESLLNIHIDDNFGNNRHIRTYCFVLFGDSLDRITWDRWFTIVFDEKTIYCSREELLTIINTYVPSNTDYQRQLSKVAIRNISDAELALQICNQSRLADCYLERIATVINESDDDGQVIYKINACIEKFIRHHDAEPLERFLRIFHPFLFDPVTIQDESYTQWSIVALKIWSSLGYTAPSQQTLTYYKSRSTLRKHSFVGKREKIKCLTILLEHDPRPIPATHSFLVDTVRVFYPREHCNLWLYLFQHVHMFKGHWLTQLRQWRDNVALELDRYCIPSLSRIIVSML